MRALNQTMNRRRLTWLLLLMATALVLRLSHWPPAQGARNTRIVIERDTGDPKIPAGRGSTREGFDAYFTKANPIPNRFTKE